MVHGPQQVIGGVPVKCWTQQASDVSSSSSLFDTTSSSWNADVIDGWISDGQCEFAEGCNDTSPANDASPDLGHRRNTLDPSKFAMGFGAVPLAASNPELQRLALLSRWSLGPADDARRFRGLAAYRFRALSGGLQAVVVRHPERRLQQRDREHDAQRGRDPRTTINCHNGATGTCSSISGPAVTLEDGRLPARRHRLAEPAADDKFVVTIGGVTVNGVAVAPITYPVTVFDPAVC